MDLSFTAIIIFYQLTGITCKKGFYIYSETRSWFEAQTRCAQFNTTTANPRTEFDLNQLIGVLSKANAVDRGAWLGGYLMDRGWTWESDGTRFYHNKGCYKWYRAADKIVPSSVSSEDVLEDCADFCGDEYSTDNVVIGLTKERKCFCLEVSETKRLKKTDPNKCKTEKNFFSVSKYDIGLFTDSHENIGCYETIEYVIVRDNSIQGCQKHCTESASIALQANRCICFGKTSDIKIIPASDDDCTSACPGNPSEICGNITEKVVSVYSKAGAFEWEWEHGHPLDGQHCSSVDLLQWNILRSEMCSSLRMFRCSNGSGLTEGNASTWYNASEYCKSIGGYLVTPAKSKRSSRTSNGTRYWTGLRRNAVWVWNDGSNVTQRVLETIPGKLMRNNKNCLSVRRQNGTHLALTASKCQTVLPVVCENGTDETGETLTTISTMNDTSISIDISDKDTQSTRSMVTVQNKQQEVVTDYKGTEETSGTLTTISDINDTSFSVDISDKDTQSNQNKITDRDKQQDVATDYKVVYIGVAIAIGLLVLLGIFALGYFIKRKKRRYTRAVRTNSIVYENTLRPADRTGIMTTTESERTDSVPLVTVTSQETVHNNTYGEFDTHDCILSSSPTADERSASDTESTHGYDEYSVAYGITETECPEQDVQKGISDKREATPVYSQVNKQRQTSKAVVNSVKPELSTADGMYDKLGETKSSQNDKSLPSNVYAHTSDLYGTQDSDFYIDPEYSNMDN